jgi:hypothetical protein
MTPLQIVLLIIAINALIWVPVIVWTRRRTARLIRETEDSLMLVGEKAVVGPESAFFRKPMLGRVGSVSGNAIVTLTEKRLIIRPLVGSEMEFPRGDIVGVKESKWYQASAKGGYTHVIVTMKDGREMAVLVRDPKPWVAGLGKG